jgi:hypothetical protein
VIAIPVQDNIAANLLKLISHGLEKEIFSENSRIQATRIAHGSPVQHLLPWRGEVELLSSFQRLLQVILDGVQAHGQLDGPVRVAAGEFEFA